MTTVYAEGPLVDETVLAPVRAVADAAEVKVKWDAKERKVSSLNKWCTLGVNPEEPVKRSSAGIVLVDSFF